LQSSKTFFNIIGSALDELSDKKLKFIFIKIFALTIVVLSLIIFTTFNYLFQEFDKFLSPENYENLFLLWLFKFKIITFLLLIFQFFFIWFFFIIIIIPISSIISGLFADEILEIIQKKNRYKIKEKRKKNAFLISFLYSCKSGLKTIFVNILAIPLYFLLPVANIIIFILINSYFVSREFIGNILCQYFDEKKINEFYMYNSRDVYLIGCFITILFLIPIVNLAAGFLGFVISTKFFFENKVKN